MRRRFIMRLTRAMVLKYYPEAVCQRRDSGKEYYQVWMNQLMLGQGKTEDEAWKAAYRNVTT